MPPRFRWRARAFSPDDFEWDPVKSDRNLESRGFDFGFAALIFQGRILERRDTRHRREIVHQAIGEAANVLLFVVYTIRRERCRIISARRATPDEARLYHEQ